MKFRKGNLVEVLRREHDPCGSWFTGEILSADGDNYNVRYELLEYHKVKRVTEKVRGKDVRPLPPSVNGKSWAVGDITEVFDIQCWRVAKVAKVLNNGNRFVLKFFGSIQLKEFHASSLRIRQAWHGNKWIVTGKVAENKNLVDSITPKIPFLASSLHFGETMRFRARDRGGEHKGETHNIATCLPILAKSKLWGECNMDTLIGRTFKKRKSSLCSRGCDVTPNRALPLLKQGYDISTNGNGRMQDTTPHCFCDSSRPVWSTEDSDQCSVASCSLNGDYVGQISHKLLDSAPDNSDAESAFPSLCYSKVYDMHKLELRAYKSTMEALFVSGPLTWAKESLLTNLRFSLNISDEEHLLLLRHLLSTQAL
ncbi:hypothetical protein F3Y22_tig00110860pilonHSYRG00021 [Hibiscus syriacus]|uniref:ENT domain-containing protein n=1 Tax=Hibiscus syriacus TaxID=106335 RepID=A0A6A2ZK08_HIBSY|nr:uncharacterized protein LOC120143637 [Hibiscus syriacus]KAE8692063.1 hypothetical protein F3Y22_tig00110860pilonHSYRG00021 [Hibiscus syriacus]